MSPPGPACGPDSPRRHLLPRKPHVSHEGLIQGKGWLRGVAGAGMRARGCGCGDAGLHQNC